MAYIIYTLTMKCVANFTEGISIFFLLNDCVFNIFLHVSALILRAQDITVLLKKF